MEKIQTKEEVGQMYHDWQNENGQEPNRVIVKMRWEDDDNTEKGYQVDTIGIVPSDRIGNTDEEPGDSMILYYVSSLDELLGLMSPDNGSDFVVLEVLEFWKA